MTTKIVTPLMALMAILAFSASPASAATPSPAWSLHSVAQPTNFQSSDTNDQYTLSLTNVGSQDSDGSTIIVTDTLPAGITTSATPKEIPNILTSTNVTKWSCSPGAGQSVVTCQTSAVISAQQQADGISIPVGVSPSASGTLSNQASVSGGAAPASALASTPTLISPATSPFDLLDFSASALDPSGALDTQGGDHPAALTTEFDFPSANVVFASSGEVDAYPVGGAVKQTIVDLPAGLVGNPLAAPACTLTQLTNTQLDPPHGCPAAAQVGSMRLIEPPITQANEETAIPIYNIVPEHGYPAEFGVLDPVLGRSVLLYATVVGSGANTHLRVTSQNLPRALPIEGVSVLFYGNPAIKDNSPNSPIAFATNPTDCTSPQLMTTIHADSWNNPGASNPDGTPDFSDPNWKSATAESPPVSGCNKLQFNPSISLQPDTTQPSSPTGLNVDLQVPQTTDPNGLATPPLKDATVTLPEGMSVSPSAADGLLGCSDAQIELASNNPPACPEGSQIGTVLVHTPLLDHTLSGMVYLGTPHCAPCSNADAASGEMLRLFIVINDPETGVVVKLPGTVSANPNTGQLTATFANNPQLPFDDLKLAFKSGARATLSTPATCGTFTSTADLSPWSSPFTPDASLQSSFTIAGCGGPRFAPSFTAGTANNQAGAYSPFALSFSRQDADQQFSGLSMTLPPGLLAKLAGVPLCSDANANAGSCPAASQVGSVTTGAGPGSHPFFLPGQVFLTGPYKGGPFGLAVQVPAVAGPFNLGTVVVRQSLRVDPHTAQASVISDPFPSILDGIPLQIRTVSVTIDRPGFTFNPTSCEPMQIAGTLISLGGLNAPVSSRFQAANCANLPFKPSFRVSTEGKTSKANGASLIVKVAQNPGEANIHKVNLQLPLALPSRLTTLQKACTEAQFNANPAGCPEGSVIGTAKAVTPVLNVPLTGPAYLVSHGGAAFPDVEFILQGEGVEIVLDGKTDIKKGITYSRFETVPDAPISSFETVLPEGSHSALAAYGNLCAQSLVMPTTIIGQNGAQVAQSTNIAVTGCGKPSIKITKAKIKGNTVLVTVTTTQQGTVTVSGNGLKTIKKTLAAGAHQLKVSLTKNGRTARKHHKKTKIKVRVKNTNGSSSKTMTLKL